jgi:hypothetical protein
MARIVRTIYRYQRPPRKRQAVALEVPAVVKAADPVKARKRIAGQGSHPAPGKSEPTAPPHAPANGDRTPAPPPAAERKSAIVTVRRPSRFGAAEDLPPEERNRRADLADAMMQEFKRLMAEKIRS